MTVSLAITGLIAWLVSGAAVNANGSLTGIGMMLFQSPLGFIFMLAPLGLVMLLSFRIQKMQASTAQTMFWVLSGCYGISLASIFLAYTGESVARVFFISSSTFLAASLYGYILKSPSWIWFIFNDGSHRYNYCNDCKYISTIYNDAIYDKHHRCLDFHRINCI